MDVFVIGSGGREHAIIWSLLKNKSIKKIYCAPGNGGISEIAECVDINICDNAKLLKFVKEKNIDYTIVGPETPLVNGIVDLFISENLKIFGPCRNCAMLEGSKIFSKAIMQKYNIPTAKAKAFNNPEKAIDFVKKNTWARVIKADGLAAGKGVYVCNDQEDAINAIIEIMINKKFGKSGDNILIEEKLIGEEASFLVFSDGFNVKPMLSCQDHKAVFDNDKGPNTGGMGAYSPAPIVTKNIRAQVMEKIIAPIIRAMQIEGTPYKGVLYAGLMITKDGPSVIEFNCRFGDPETQPLLSLLKSDLLELITACINGTLGNTTVAFKNEAACSVVMASGGYPGTYEKGKLITGLVEANKLPNLIVFHSGTKKIGSDLYTDGGRVLSVNGIGNSIDEAIRNAYIGVNKIHFENSHFRKDIGMKALGR
ncbi:MAG: phosphoribosylamine--glycine ligase [archaeon]